MEDIQNNSEIFENGTMLCVTIPLTFSSPGILEATSEHNKLLGGYLTYSLPLLELQIALIFIVSQAFHFFLKRFGVTLFVSCILTGIVLGPTILGKQEFMAGTVFSEEGQKVLRMIVVFGTHIFVFLSAVKMDAGIILKTGRKAMSIGALSLFAPLIVGLFYITFIKKKQLASSEELIGMFRVTQMQSITAFPVIAYLLDHLRISNSEVGRLGLSSALFADVLGIITAIVSSLINQNYGSKLKDFFGIIAYLVFLLFVFRPAMLWIIRQTPQGKPIESTYICIIMPMAFLSGFCFVQMHQGTFLGPFLLGLTVPAGPPLGSAFINKFESFTLGILLPLQVATSMFTVDILTFVPALSELKYYIAVIILLFVVKLAACLIPPLFCKMPLFDSVALACIMSSEGIIELTVYIDMKDRQEIRQEVLAIAVLFILLNSTFTPILVKYLYDPSGKYAGYQTRNIVSLKPESELRILTCINTPDNIASVIRFLNTINPTKESPVTVFVLQLIELIGRATPVFLTHRKNKPISICNSCSQNVILSFNQYEQNNQNSVSVHNFTAISLVKLMSEDACTLALNKLTSLILIPLHQKWSNLGLTESENRIARTLSRTVLEKAPCSVGIFFDRTKYSHHSKPIKAPNGIFSSLSMIFLGGNDDREALSLAKRMSKNTFASLTIVHVIADNEDNNGFESEERVLDAAAVDEAKHCAYSDDLSVEYRSYSVKDGPQTALLLHSIAHDFDLFIVGRRSGIESPQTVGLSQWSEFPELGIIGDLLASRDLNTEASVLIVQQQRKMRILN